jgi:enamine deaminase RidA (YjgF/YER057c/UK114 family)
MSADYRRSMIIEKINPPELAEPAGYAHVVVATGTRRVYVAGQTGVGNDGIVVGSDLASQTAQALRNVGTALSAGGATWDDVVKMNILIVGYEPSMVEGLFAGVGEVFGESMPIAATTLYGVQSLFEPDHLVEIDVVAEV